MHLPYGNITYLHIKLKAVLDYNTKTTNIQNDTKIIKTTFISDVRVFVASQIHPPVYRPIKFMLLSSNSANNVISPLFLQLLSQVALVCY